MQSFKSSISEEFVGSSGALHEMPRCSIKRWPLVVQLPS